MAAHEQGKFWEMHDKLFANQQKLSRDQYIAYAKELKLDVAKFEKTMDDAALKAKGHRGCRRGGFVGRHRNAGVLRRTGSSSRAPKPFEEFAKAVNAELKRLNLPIPAGAPQS
jgi:hypothetical protein